MHINLYVGLNSNEHPLLFCEETSTCTAEVIRRQTKQFTDHFKLKPIFNHMDGASLIKDNNVYFYIDYPGCLDCTDYMHYIKRLGWKIMQCAEFKVLNDKMERITEFSKSLNLLQKFKALAIWKG